MSDSITQKLERFEATISQNARAVQLPIWPEPRRGVPNAFLRSALFPAVHRQGVVYLKEEKISTFADLSIIYSGERLDQSDLDVWQQAVHLARCSPLGHECHFSAHGFLKSLGRNTGRSDHRWLASTFTRLQATAVRVVEQKPGTIDVRLFSDSLIEKYDSETTAAGTRYRLRLSERLINLFSDGKWTAHDWQQRRLLSRKPLALWLHAFYSTHARPFPLKLDTIMTLCGSKRAVTAANGGPAGLTARRGFKREIKAALDELTTIGFLTGWSIEGDKVTVFRVNFPAIGTA